MMKVSDIAQLLAGEIYGDADFAIQTICSVRDAKPLSAALVYSPKDAKALSETQADVIIGPTEILKYREQVKALVVIKKLDVQSLNNLLRTYKVNKYKLFDQGNTSDIPDVYIGKYCTIGQNCHFSPGVKIMNGVTIGDNVAINANTIIKEGTVIGDNVTIDTNNSIGNFSFQYMTGITTKYERVESIGQVIIADDVDIGCNNTIDRGSFGNTVIGRGTKIDNQVQIGHDCQIGSNCLLVSQCGLAGNTILGNNVIIQGQVGTAGNLSIGNNSIVKAKSGVSRSFPNNSNIFGYPAKDSKEYFRNLSTLNLLTKQLSEMRKNKKQSSEKSRSLIKRLFG